MIPEDAVLRLDTPLALLALFLPILLVWWSLRKARRPHLIYSDLRLLAKIEPGWRARIRGLPLALRTLALLLLVLALARPQAENRLEEVLSEGVDIIVALDHSGSMAAVDLGDRGEGIDPTSRLDFARQVVGDFVLGRQADRIGLVVFAGRAFTRCPLTLDYGLLTQVLDTIKITKRYDVEESHWRLRTLGRGTCGRSATTFIQKEPIRRARRMASNSSGQDEGVDRFAKHRGCSAGYDPQET